MKEPTIAKICKIFLKDQNICGGLEVSKNTKSSKWENLGKWLIERLPNFMKKLLPEKWLLKIWFVFDLFHFRQFPTVNSFPEERLFGKRIRQVISSPSLKTKSRSFVDLICTKTSFQLSGRSIGNWWMMMNSLVCASCNPLFFQPFPFMLIYII